MKRKLIVSMLTAVLLISCLAACLTSCGSKDMAVVENGYGMEAADKNSSISESSTASGGIGAETGNKVTDNRKIIVKTDLTIETKTFDSLIPELEKKIAEMGGYIESSSYDGNSYSYFDRRTASLTVRIPADSSDAFCGFVSENANVTSKSVSTDDVTLTYVDMESRVSALETEKAALEEILAKAKTVEDIISVRSSLTDVIYEIESYKSQLRTYDDLVDFATVNISIFEVEKETVVEEQSTWEKIGFNLKNNFESVWEGIVAFFVFLVSSIPYILLLAVIAVIVVLIVKFCARRVKRKKEAKKNRENL